MMWGIRTVLDTGGTFGAGRSETEIGAQVLNHVALGVTITDGHVQSNPDVTFLGGENVFLGYGAQKYW